MNKYIVKCAMLMLIKESFKVISTNLIKRSTLPGYLNLSCKKIVFLMVLDLSI